MLLVCISLLKKGNKNFIFKFCDERYELSYIIAGCISSAMHNLQYILSLFDLMQVIAEEVYSDSIWTLSKTPNTMEH